MNEKILFYAPVGNLIKGFKNGGAEAGCRKTMEVLKKAGYQVILVEKPARSSGSVLAGLILLARLMIVWVKLVFKFVTEKNAVFHIVGFYLNQVYFEKLLVATAKKLHVKTIYEIRNGGMIEAYWNGSPRYKKAMGYVLTNSDTVLCQGYDYVLFLKNEFHRDSIYYPNYIMDKFIRETNNNSRIKDKDMKLIYFGRVVPDKNIEFIIDTCHELRKLSHSDFTLDIIGGYEEDYYQALSERINNLELKENITFHGRQDFSFIADYLVNSHFFIFPSREKREGHSNSLTEAMGSGVVPVVSDAGFNRSIVGCDPLVIEQFDPLKYAETIWHTWSNNQWKDLSDMAYTRVKQHFTESIVKDSILNGYREIFSSSPHKN